MSETPVSLVIGWNPTHAQCHGHLNMTWVWASMLGRHLNASNAHDQMVDT